MADWNSSICIASATSFWSMAAQQSAFSVMLGAYFGSNLLLTSLSNTKEAPAAFRRKTKNRFYQNAWFATGVFSLIIVEISFFLSFKLFNYPISSCSYFSFFNWTINLIVYLLWLKHRHGEERFSSPLIFGSIGCYVTIFLICILSVVSLWVKDFRIGFYSATVITILISLAYFVLKKFTNQKPGKEG